MSVYRTKSINELGIPFVRIEELTIYDVQNAQQHKALCDKLNKQICKDAKSNITAEFITIDENTTYPAEIVTDFFDMITWSEDFVKFIRNKKNKGKNMDIGYKMVKVNW